MTTADISFPTSRVLQETRTRGQAVRVAQTLNHAPSSKLTAKWAREPEGKCGAGTGRKSPFENAEEHLLAEDLENHATGSALLFHLAWRIRQQRRQHGFCFSLPTALMFLTKAVSKAALVCCSPNASQKQKETKAYTACVAMMEFWNCVLAGRDVPESTGQLKQVRLRTHVNPAFEKVQEICKAVNVFAKKLKRIEEHEEVI